jgi:hypothetical protein
MPAIPNTNIPGEKSYKVIGIPPGKPKPKPKPIKPGKPKPPVKPIGPKPKPEKPGNPSGDYTFQPKPKPDFGKQLGQQPITMGEDYKKQINNIRPIGNGSAMNKQYRAQGGGRFK